MRFCLHRPVLTVRMRNYMYLACERAHFFQLASCIVVLNEGMDSSRTDLWTSCVGECGVFGFSSKRTF